MTKKTITETETKEVLPEQEHQSTFSPGEKLSGEKRKRNRVNNYSQNHKDDLPDSGSENAQESVGSEDEKDNYSPGGDNHDNPQQER